ncbi:MAG: hypothetical protein EOS36_30215 [Mesorhizobium sp.]|nr:MAG: hypothetical protein EOS36_30215 [Mesorhizobium sp.]RWE31741.1 MAG: hypothetical protein EOS79_31650 [Mesorhizobium sp.]
MPKTGRSLIGTVAGFKSEWWPVFDRNGGRLHVGIRIDDKDAILIAQRLHYIIANLDPRPSGCAPQRLHPIGKLRSGLLSHQPARLASMPERAVKEICARLSQFTTRKHPPNRASSAASSCSKPTMTPTTKRQTWLPPYPVELNQKIK